MQECLHINHTACNAQTAKTAFLCPTAIAKSNSEDNPVQRIMVIGAVADIQEIKSKHAASICEHCDYR